MTKRSDTAAAAPSSLHSRAQEMLSKGDSLQFATDVAQDSWITGKIQDVFDQGGDAADDTDADSGVVVRGDSGGDRSGGGRGGGGGGGGGDGCVLIDACDHGTHEKARYQRRTLRLFPTPQFPQPSSARWQDAATHGLYSLDDLAGVWVDNEKPEQVMRVAHGWVFNFEGQPEERGVVEIKKTPPPSAGLVLEAEKQWALDHAASSGRRAVWKREGKDDVIWRRRGGHPSTAAERNGTAAPRGGYTVMHGEVLRYQATAHGTWRDREISNVEFLKLAPMVRVIDGSAPVKIVRLPVWPADDEKNATSHNKNELSAGDLVCFSCCKRVPIPLPSEPGVPQCDAATAANMRQPEHVVFFYELSDGRGWVHDYMPFAPAIRRLEVRCHVSMPCVV
jgi:hypothetical protein